jgi:hypothetical protein
MWKWIKKFCTKPTRVSSDRIIAYAGGYLVRVDRISGEVCYWHKVDTGVKVLDNPGLVEFSKSMVREHCWVETIDEARAIRERNWKRVVE